MVFGSCCILVDDRLKGMNAKSIKIEGVQRGLIVNFEVTQTFSHSEKEPKEASYVFPNDLKICIYDTTFVVGEEIIKPKLQSKEEAKKTYKEAIDSGRTAVYGSNIGYGLTEFKLGNLQPETECKVILKIAFTAQVTKEKTFFIKFPLDVYTPSGSKGCLDVISSNFSFRIQSENDKIASITSNVKNGNYDASTKIFSINEPVKCDDNQKSVILTFETNENLTSSALLTPQNTPNYDGCAITISPNLPPSQEKNSEFLFVIDCSGSMGGNSIKKAAECLEFFIRSLPPKSFFNVIRFGSRFEKLFDDTVEYNEETAEKAINLAQNLKSDLGGTNIYSPLQDIFGQKIAHGQRQIFIMTDGEVNDVAQVLQLISSNANDNRCFTIGIGRGCDAGLVEGMATASGGKSDFVQEGDSISDKVIPQLQSSLHPSLNSIEIHIEGEGNDAFQISPFPLPPINANGANVIYLREKKKENAFEGGILITGSYGKESIDIPVEETERLQNAEEDKFGCSGGKNIGNAILPLFAFWILQTLERKRDISDDDKQKAIELSIASGVLCKYTGYVGMTENPIETHRFERMCYNAVAAPKRCCNCCRCAAAAGPMHCCDCSCCCNSATLRCHKAKMSAGVVGMKCSKAREEDECCRIKERQRIEEEKRRRIEEEKRRRIEEEKRRRIEEEKRRQIEEQLPKNYDLLTLTRYQKIAGYWVNLSAINSMIGLNIDHIDEVNLSDESLNNNCVATILAIAAMRVKSAGDKGSWVMIEQKAIEWLKQTLPGVDIEQVIQNVQKLIH